MNLFDFLHSLSSYKRSGVTKRLTLSVKAIIKNCHKKYSCYFSNTNVPMKQRTMKKQPN